MKIHSLSAQETISAGKNLAKTLKGGDIVLLNGDLGAGKTTFTKGVAIGLGIEQMVTSPTFIIFNSYKGSSLKLNHFDMYRLKDGEECLDSGLDEFIFEQGAVSLIEWSENIASILPQNAIRVEIKILGEQEREIEITFYKHS